MDAGGVDTDGRRGIGELLRELADGGSTLVRHEIRLARLEAGELARAVGKGTGFVGAGGVLLLLGALAFLTGLMMLAGDQWLRDHVWLAALVVMLVAGGLAVWLARRGMRLLAPERLAPDQTVESLREDREWLKRQLTSDATSS